MGELVNTYADYFSGNVVTGDQSRSAKDLSFAIFLVKKGLTPDEIVVVLSHAEYNKGKDLKDAYLERTISKAMEVTEELKISAGKAGESPASALQMADSSSKLGHPPVLLKYSEIKSVHYPPVERFSTGIRCIDDYTNGGLGLRELSLFVAEQETGKTTMACYIGGEAQKQGYNVLHVHYEDEVGDIKARYDGHLRDTGSDAEVFFLDATEKPVTIEGIEDGIRRTQPGLVIVDYLARIPGVNDNRFEIRDLMFKFGNIMRQYNTHIMLLDHVLIEPERTDKNGNVVPTPYKMALHRLSEAKMYKAMTTSIMIGLMKDRQDTTKTWVTGLKMKRKKGKAKLFQSITIDWETGKYTG